PSEKVAALVDEDVRMLMNKAQNIAYEILREHRDYLDTLAEKLLEKETLRRPDLESIFEGITPREVAEIFPGQDLDRPKDYREPVKTPVELAKERGEEPPKRKDYFSAARRARIEKRKQQQEEQVKKLEREQESRQEPQRGFELPEHERPDNPWTSDDAPTTQLRPVTEAGEQVSESRAAGEPAPHIAGPDAAQTESTVPQTPTPRILTPEPYNGGRLARRDPAQHPGTSAYGDGIDWGEPGGRDHSRPNDDNPSDEEKN